MKHAELRELTAGAALDDLDPDERRALDAHLAVCDDCRALLVQLDDVLADFALVATELHPPAGLQREVLAAIRSERAGPSDTTGGRPWSSPSASTSRTAPRRW